MTHQLMTKLKLCKLAAVRSHFDRIQQEAESQQWSYERFLEALVDEEILLRENRRFLRLLRRARFPIEKTIEQFDFSQAPYLSKKEVMELLECSFVDQKDNLILVGAPGTGKTHISIALGIEACKRGKKVMFFTAANLGNRLVEMQDERHLTDFLGRLRDVNLLIIDELGYVELSDRTTQLIFQVFSERCEKGSVVINTNLEFSEWAKIFHSERMTAAILDRLIHNSRIILFNGESFRYRQRREEKSKKPKKDHENKGKE